MKNERTVGMWYFAQKGMWKIADIRAHFADMKDTGVDVVLTNFLERSGERVLRYRGKYVHEAGLKVYAVPGRIAGLFAAAPVPGSMFVVMHRDTRMRMKDGSHCPLPVCCVNNPEFQEWFYPMMNDVLVSTNMDGIAFDEPKDAHVPCYCEHCKALVDDHTEENMIRLREKSMAETMNRVCREAAEKIPGFKSVVMVMPNATPTFKEYLLAQDKLDYLGHDGPMCPQGPDNPPKGKQKTSLAESLPPFIQQIKAAGKKTFCLPETFGVYNWALDILRGNIEQILDWDVDLYSFNYYAHDVDNDEGIMEIIRDVVRRIKS